MNITKTTIKDLSRTLSPDEEKELMEAEKISNVFDDDSPQMTAEMLRQFKRMGHGAAIDDESLVRKCL